MRDRSPTFIRGQAVRARRADRRPTFRGAPARELRLHAFLDAHERSSALHWQQAHGWSLGTPGDEAGRRVGLVGVGPGAGGREAAFGGDLSESAVISRSRPTGHRRARARPVRRRPLPPANERVRTAAPARPPAGSSSIAATRRMRASRSCRRTASIMSACGDLVGDVVSTFDPRVRRIRRGGPPYPQRSTRPPSNYGRVPWAGASPDAKVPT